MTCPNTPPTLFIADEVSGVDELNLSDVSSWCGRVIEITSPVLKDNTFYTRSTVMRPDILVDVIEGLVKADNGETAPYTVVVPWDTNLDAQYKDGQDDLGTLRERIVRIKDVKDVLCGRGNGTSLEHYKE